MSSELSCSLYDLNVQVRNWQERGDAEDSYEFASKDIDEAAAQVENQPEPEFKFD